MTTNKTKAMRIVALTAENVKRLTAVHIEPTGNVVQITGRNRQGKTSVLDAIWWAIEGAEHIQASPIRKGATKARIRLDLGEIIVTRKFSAKEDGGFTTSITVESPDGAVFKSPQKLLDDLVGELSFDPLAFGRMKPRDKFDALRKFVEGVDIAHLDALNEGDFKRRTDINRDLKNAKAAVEATVVAADPPAERVDTTELVAQMEKASEHNSDIETRKANRLAAAERIEALRAAAVAHLANVDVTNGAVAKRLGEDVADIEQQIQALQARIETLRAKAAEQVAGNREYLTSMAASATREADEIEAKVAAAPPLAKSIDVANLAAQINAANDSNRLLDQWEKDIARKRELQAAADDLAQQSDELTAKITERAQQKQAAIAKAHLPVDGIGFGDGYITLRGVPFEQGSDAEQLEASVAIAAALNPKLRVIRIRDGSLLDDDAMQRLGEIAEQRDFQVWIERVDGSGTVGFVLEDGHLKGAEQATESAA